MSHMLNTWKHSCVIEAYFSCWFKMVIPLEDEIGVTHFHYPTTRTSCRFYPYLAQGTFFMLLQQDVRWCISFPNVSGLFGIHFGRIRLLTFIVHTSWFLIVKNGGLWYFSSVNNIWTFFLHLSVSRYSKIIQLIIIILDNVKNVLCGFFVFLHF